MKAESLAGKPYQISSFSNHHASSNDKGRWANLMRVISVNGGLSIGLSALMVLVGPRPRAMPQAGIFCTFGAWIGS